ncbi:large ribosomal subunit protein uL24m-like [Diadema antillarum]|uniref:large ribosomal subunit protein uL24m-like n=1 Tax=Diadema antillarum TaxID=105358 RepID=UPI003A85728B
MVRLSDLLLKVGRQTPAWKKANRHYRYGMSRPWTIQAQIQNLPGRGRPKVLVEPIKEWKIFRGDLVEVLKGRDTNKQGIVSDIIKQRNWVIVEGLNCHYRRIGKMPGYSGTMIVSEGPLNIRDVALVDPSDNKPTDIEFRYTEAGEKVRVSQRTGRIIPVPIVDSDSRDYKTKDTYIEQPKDSVAEDVCKKTFTPSLKTVEAELMEAYNIQDPRTPRKTYWY